MATAARKQLGKYQGRERRQNGGWLECLIKREGPTPITMDGFQYVFSPGMDGRAISFIQNPVHVERLLADTGAFREIFPEQERADRFSVPEVKTGDLKIDDDDDDATPVEIPPALRATVIDSYFVQKLPMKAIAHLEGISGVINRPVISEIINQEKGRRGEL